MVWRRVFGCKASDLRIIKGYMFPFISYTVMKRKTKKENVLLLVPKLQTLCGLFLFSMFAQKTEDSFQFGSFHDSATANKEDSDLLDAFGHAVNYLDSFFLC